MNSFYLCRLATSDEEHTTDILPVRKKEGGTPMSFRRLESFTNIGEAMTAFNATLESQHGTFAVVSWIEATHTGMYFSAVITGINEASHASEPTTPTAADPKGEARRPRRLPRRLAETSVVNHASKSSPSTSPAYDWSAVLEKHFDVPPQQ